MATSIRKLSEPAKKLAKDVAKINTRLMDENMTLKQFVAEQAEYIRKMQSRKHKAHRRLKALRELNRHVELLQAQNRVLFEHNLRMRLITRTLPAPMPFSLIRTLNRLFGWGRGD